MGCSWFFVARCYQVNVQNPNNTNLMEFAVAYIIVRHDPADLVFPSSLIGIIEQKQWRTFKFSLKNVGEMPGGKQETKVFFFCVFSPTIFFLMFFVFVVFVSFRRCGFCVLINVVA